MHSNTLVIPAFTFLIVVYSAYAQPVEPLQIDIDPHDPVIIADVKFIISSMNLAYEFGQIFNGTRTDLIINGYWFQLLTELRAIQPINKIHVCELDYIKQKHDEDPRHLDVRNFNCTFHVKQPVYEVTLL